MQNDARLYENIIIAHTGAFKKELCARDNKPGKLATTCNVAELFVSFTKYLQKFWYNTAVNRSLARAAMNRLEKCV